MKLFGNTAVLIFDIARGDVMTILHGGHTIGACSMAQEKSYTSV